jgi:hypothetical protein
VPAGTATGVPETPSGLMASIHAPATGDQPQEDPAGMQIDPSEFPSLQVMAAPPAGVARPTPTKPPVYKVGVTSSTTAGSSTSKPALSQTVGNVGEANKKRKRPVAENSPVKRRVAAGTFVDAQTGLLIPLGCTGATCIWNGAWEALLLHPGESTKDKVDCLLQDIYNPLRQRVADELRGIREQCAPLNTNQWRFLHGMTNEVPRVSWLKSPQNRPPGIRVDTADCVNPRDYTAWGWLREIIPKTQGLEATSAVADTINPRLWGVDNPNQSNGMFMIPYNVKGKLDPNKVRAHLRDTCKVTLSFLESQIRKFVLRTLAEIQ